MKVVISYVSIADARKNLAAAIPDWDFDAWTAVPQIIGA